jgi:hypothetical protein
MFHRRVKLERLKWLQEGFQLFNPDIDSRSCPKYLRSSSLQ